MADDKGPGKGPGGRGPGAKGSEGKSRRKRRRGPGRGRPGADKKSGAPAEGEKRRRRRRRGPREGQPGERREGGPGPSRSRGRDAARKPERKAAPQPASAPPSDVDLGWDDEPVAVLPEKNKARPRRKSVAESIAWGDDSSAPEPTEPLSADLPEERSGDLDPSTLSCLEDTHDVALDRAIASIAGVKFATAGKIYEFDAQDAVYAVGARVAVEGDRSTRTGTIAVAPMRRAVTRPLKKILRLAKSRGSSPSETDSDRDALVAAKKSARDLGLPVKIFRVESQGGRNRVVVYFSSEKKIEQRQLARELAQSLGARVELRQTGVRDEAKIIGGIGSCGRELCCTTWLPAFVPVSIKNAKDQGLVLNPTKVSGQCGRLKCCLVYEQATYAEARKGLPKLGKRVITEDGGEGRVVEVDVLKRRVRVNLGDGRFEVLEASAVKPMFPSQPQGGGGGGEKKKRRKKKSESEPEETPQTAEPGAPTEAPATDDDQ